MTRIAATAAVYALLITGAIWTSAAGLERQEIMDLRIGDMRKLVVHEAPREASALAVALPDGTPATLEDYLGKAVVLNFWATWCAPCRKEMPSLAELQSELADSEAVVLAVAVGRNDPDDVERFLSETGAENLAIAYDPRQTFASSFGVLGLPATVLIDPDGYEVARLTGDADWSSDSAIAIVATIAGASPPAE